MRDDEHGGSELTETVRCLSANMSREQLFRTVLPQGLAGRLLAMISPVRGVAEAFIPFHLFDVTINNAGRTETRQFAIDAVTHGLDLYEVNHNKLITAELNPRNLIPASDNSEQAEHALIERVRRMVFRRGFFAVRDMTITAALVNTFYVPYWVVLAGGEHDLKLRVFDAVRCRPEGAKVRAIVRQWILASDSRTPARANRQPTRSS